ncbi:unnamed protein product [Anisakis simplex]|uniref:NDRG4 protein (inferred by orthology to a S. mansoni protein) n=1 Tax=Anisakis simplex TaxID=6269 RepID=A0A0M3J321_ANISI|nr:unnamed protein product [Anisakis simplex]
MEMGIYPFTHDQQPLMDHAPDLEEKVPTVYGNVKVTIYGDRKRHPIVTFHDLALDSENNFQNFFQFGSVADFTEKFCVYNINAPGQEMDAAPLPENYVYPTMDGLAKIVEACVKHFEIKSFIGFGVGAGANVMLRYARELPSNCTDDELYYSVLVGWTVAKLHFAFCMIAILLS